MVLELPPEPAPTAKSHEGQISLVELGVDGFRFRVRFKRLLRQTSLVEFRVYWLRLRLDGLLGYSKASKTQPRYWEGLTIPQQKGKKG